MRVHPRVHERHPGISDEDVRAAWDGYSVACSYDRAERELRVGLDMSGREIETVGVLKADGWLVYHAMTPPTRKFLMEIDRQRRRA